LKKAQEWMAEALNEECDNHDIVLNEKEMQKCQQVEEEQEKLLHVNYKDFKFENSQDYENIMNADQKIIYNDVIKSVVEFESAGRKYDPNNLHIKPLRAFCTGPAGTGKSLLIEAISVKLQEMFEDETNVAQVKRFGPTGIAAINIYGTTIHKGLKLRVQKQDGDQMQKPLSDPDVLGYRKAFNKVKLLIFDEVSMISNETSALINDRLNQICGISDGLNEIEEIDENWTTFGRKPMILFGDFLQLQPVAQPFIFEDITYNQAQKILGVTAIPNLFNQFSYYELTEQMRQKDDSDFQELLNNIRIGTLTKKDHELLKKQELQVPFRGRRHFKELARIYKEKFNDIKPVCLFPLREDVAYFNEEMLFINDIKIVTVKAKDDVDQTNVNTKTKKSKKDVNATAGLEDTLKIGIGARIMLRRNISVEENLVNGSMGTIVGLLYDKKVLKALRIEFDDIEEIKTIEKVTGDYEYSKNIIAHRTQFPITLAYGLTIHKCQGLTLEYVIIDCTSGISQPAQFYVALSRGKTLEKVRIINYNPRFIKCSVKAVEKINQMRSHCTNKLIAPFPSCNQIPEDILSEYKIEKKHQLTIPIDRSELHDDEREIIEKPKRPTYEQKTTANKQKTKCRIKIYESKA